MAKAGEIRTKKGGTNSQNKPLQGSSGTHNV